MTQSDTAIHHIGAMVSAIFLTDAKAKLGPSAVQFACGTEEFEMLVTRAAHAALRVMPYKDIFNIAVAMQRQEMLAAGVPLMADQLEDCQSFSLAS